MDFPWPKNARFAKIGPDRIHYSVTGDGDALLILHAGIADMRMWDAQIPDLSAKYRTIRYDIRGFGRSPIPADTFANHEDPAALLDHLQVDSAHVVGASYGGLIALDFTLAHPERVRSLVLVAPSISGQEHGPEIHAFWKAEEEALERDDLDAAVEVNLRTWVDGPQRGRDQVDPAVRAKVAAMQRLAFEIEEPEEYEEIALDPPAIRRLGELRTPLLIIVGDLDLPAKLELSSYLAAEIPHARLEILPACAHLPNMEKPDQFNRLLLDFISATA
jgi:pimeloyl-ACP methyl ester carboxylesterase